MTRLQAALALGFLGGVLVLAPATGLASTTPPGTAVQINSINDLCASIWAYLVGWPGRIGAIVLILRGVSHLGGTNADGAKAGKGVLGGAAVATVPPALDTWFTSAAGATSLTAGLGAGWQFVVGVLGGRLVEDPLCVGILLATAYWLVRREHREAAIA